MNRRAHGCTHRTHGVDFETRDAVSMRRRGQPNDAGVAWVVATPGPKRFSTSKQSPIRQQHQQLKVPMPSDVRALIERKHTTITAVRGDPRRILPGSNTHSASLESLATLSEPGHELCKQGGKTND